jgi:hypothetical protein
MRTDSGSARAWAEQELSDLATTSPLLEEPDEARVQEWVIDVYRRCWSLQSIA